MRTFIKEIKQILSQARQKNYQAINTATIEVYRDIDRKIVEKEQNGKENNKRIFVENSNEFSNGFSERNIRNFIHFYFTFPEIEIS
ncbi:DUF1016 N-terminal domain-containing protein [Flavobacterium oreochromis]|uniref:DUF1016 N-terminal domain-containing protein n=1 Tax=Flavobacterium oreochromis TaxID=2906078 RepID=A0ABW8P7C3_9FLAO|nr:DUF1016 N-terminal domain-containing protein [Flavobacterium oreochromis]OWP77924.1 hypothetical protein BWG23_03885 [Flavobacterium oreochromis]POR30588.1 hypothetical protein BWK58_00960 [Flavobacterium columnare]